MECREGFNDVFPMESLESFHEDELEAMLCGVGEKWTVEKLAESIKCDHG
jgi:E3 ubiquitin-protein ligase TRIP12